jgi:hypothetical protein
MSVPPTTTLASRRPQRRARRQQAADTAHHMDPRRYSDALGIAVRNTSPSKRPSRQTSGQRSYPLVVTTSGELHLD